MDVEIKKEYTISEHMLDSCDDKIDELTKDVQKQLDDVFGKGNLKVFTVLPEDSYSINSDNVIYEREFEDYNLYRRFFKRLIIVKGRTDDTKFKGTDEEIRKSTIMCINWILGNFILQVNMDINNIEYYNDTLLSHLEELDDKYKYTPIKRVFVIASYFIVERLLFVYEFIAELIKSDTEYINKIELETKNKPYIIDAIKKLDPTNVMDDSYIPYTELERFIKTVSDFYSNSWKDGE